MNIEVQGKYIKGRREKDSKPKITRWCIIEEENQRIQHKNLSASLQAEMIH